MDPPRRNPGMEAKPPATLKQEDTLPKANQAFSQSHEKLPSGHVPLPRSQGRSLRALSPRRERAETAPAIVPPNFPTIAFSAAEGTGLQNSLNAPRGIRNITSQVDIGKECVEEKPSTPPPGITKLPIGYVNKLALIAERMYENDKKDQDSGDNISRTKSNPENKGAVSTNASASGNKGKVSPTVSRRSPHTPEALRVATARKSLERRNSGGLLERRGSSSPNVVALAAKVIFGQDSAERIMRLTPDSLGTSFARAQFPHHLSYLVLPENQFGRIGKQFLDIMSHELAKMTPEQFKGIYQSLKSDLARKRVKIVLHQKPEFQKFLALIDNDDLQRPQLINTIKSANSDLLIDTLVNQKSTAILDTPALIREIVEAFIKTKNPRELNNLILFVERYIVTCKIEQVIQVNTEIGDLVNYAKKYDLKLNEVLQEAQSSSDEPLTQEQADQLEKESQSFAPKIIYKGNSLQKCFDNISDEFFAQGIIDLILHRKTHAGTTFDTLCETFALSHVWFTSTDLLVKKVSDILRVNNVEIEQPLLKFIQILLNVAPPEYFTEANFILIRGFVAKAQTSLSENVRKLSVSLKTTLDFKSNPPEKLPFGAVVKSGSDPTPLATSTKGSKIEIITFDVLLKKKSKDAASMLANDLLLLFGNVIKNISLNDFTRLKWQKPGNSPTIDAYTTLTHELTSFFQKQILDKTIEKKKRIKCIKILINTLKLTKDNDFASSMMIISVLNTAAVSRLSRLWEKIDEVDRDFVKSFESWVGGNYSVLKNLMIQKGKNSIIPFLVPIFSELITNHEKQENICIFIAQETKNPNINESKASIINEGKAKKIADILMNFRGYQQRLDLSGKSFITAINGQIKGLKEYTNDELWQMSLLIQPSKSQV